MLRESAQQQLLLLAFLALLATLSTSQRQRITPP